MSSQAQRLTDTFRRNLSAFQNAADLPEGAEHVRVNGASSLNWVTGHVLSSRLLALDFLSTALPGVDAAEIRARYGRGTQPDPEAAVPLAGLVAALGAAQERLAQALHAADLTPSLASPLGDMPLGDLLAVIAWHEGYHAGQAVLLHHQLTGP